MTGAPFSPRAILAPQRAGVLCATGTLLGSQVFILDSVKWTMPGRMTMAGMFTSTLWVSGEILLGLLLTLFVGGMIATLGDRTRMGRR